MKYPLNKEGEQYAPNVNWIKGLGSKFRGGYRIWLLTPEEGRRVHQLINCAAILYTYHIMHIEQKIISDTLQTYQEFLTLAWNHWNDCAAVLYVRLYSFASRLHRTVNYLKRAVILKPKRKDKTKKTLAVPVISRELRIIFLDTETRSAICVEDIFSVIWIKHIFKISSYTFVRFENWNPFTWRIAVIF